MHVYEAIVKGLASIGVETAFGGNGENIASFAVALDRSKEIRLVLTGNEQAAAYMPCGDTMFTDRLGVCFATVGPGAFNLITGLGVALSDSYPVLALTGYIEKRWEGRGAVNDTSGLNRIPDSQAVFSALTKRSYLLTDVADSCDLLEEAVNLAFDGRPGPVHVGEPQNLTRHRVYVENYRDLRAVSPPHASALQRLAKRHAARSLGHARRTLQGS